MSNTVSSNTPKRKSILLIEDEVDLCTLMRNYFRRKNYEVFIAHGAEDAIQVINQITLDVIITNIDIPSWERIRKHATDKAPNVVFLLGGLDNERIRNL